MRVAYCIYYILRQKQMHNQLFFSYLAFMFFFMWPQSIFAFGLLQTFLLFYHTCPKPYTMIIHSIFSLVPTACFTLFPAASFLPMQWPILKGRRIFLPDPFARTSRNLFFFVFFLFSSVLRCMHYFLLFDIYYTLAILPFYISSSTFFHSILSSWRYDCRPNRHLQISESDLCNFHRDDVPKTYLRRSPILHLPPLHLNRLQ